MMSDIEKSWIVEAYSGGGAEVQNGQPGRFQYELLIEGFDETNIDEIATSLMLLKEPELA